MVRTTDGFREEKMGKKKRKGAAKVAATLQSGSFPYHPEEEYIDKVRPSLTPTLIEMRYRAGKVLY